MIEDAGTPDAAEVDAGATDAGEVDAGDADAGEVDAGEADAGEPDAGEVDAGPPPDREPPQTTIDSAPTPVTQGPATFTFHASEEGSTFECTLDDAPPIACESPLTLEPLVEAAHVLRIRAIDAAGNRDPTPAIARWTEDRTAPVITVTQAPAALVRSRTPRTVFTSDDSAATFTCSLDALAPVACTSPYVTPSLLDGPHALSIVATDAVGNVSESVGFAFTVDATPPDTVLVRGPAEFVAAGAVTVDVTSDDPHARFECLVDNGTFTACGTPPTFTLAAGPHSVLIRAVDEAGNADPTPLLLRWTVDVTPPNTFLTAPEPATNDADTTLVFSADDVSARFECDLGDGKFDPCVSPYVVPQDDDGAYTFAVRAVDPAGNIDATPATASWVVDRTAPSVIVTARPPALDRATTATFRFTVNDVRGTATCAIDDGAALPCTSPFTTTGLSDGDHEASFAASDALGNTSSPVRIAWLVDATPPETRLPVRPAAIVSDPRVTLLLDATEVSTFTCAVDAATPAACTSPWSVTLTEGTHTLSVTARDVAGNVDPTPATTSLRVDLTPPVVTITSGPPETGAPATAAFTFTTSETSTLHCTLDSAAPFACASPVSFADLADGPHAFRVTATDAAGLSSTAPAVHRWTVGDAPPPPPVPDTFFNAVPADPVTEPRASFSFTSDLANPTFECALDNGTFASCTSPFVWTGFTQGTHSFQVRATVAALTDASPASDTFTAGFTPPETTITSGPSGATEARTASISFIGSGFAPTFECRLDAAAFTACTSPVSLSGLADGTHTFTVRALNGGVADTTPATVSWTIARATPLTLLAGNLSSGSDQHWHDEGIRIVQGLKPDVAMLQELNVGTNSAADLRTFVDTAFGADFQVFRESGTGIPNGIVSRFPIVAAGEWDDGDTISDRDLVWARIDLPGTRDLVAVSVHLKASTGLTNETRRNTQAQTLIAQLTSAGSPLDSDDFLAIGGDFNTGNRVEPCLTTFSQVVATSGPYPADQAGDSDTNSSRAQPYDWVLVSSPLASFEVPVRYGLASFPAGLVFDSRVFTNLADVAPVQATDCAATGMQHMAVVRAFVVPP